MATKSRSTTTATVLAVALIWFGVGLYWTWIDYKPRLLELVATLLFAPVALFFGCLLLKLVYDTVRAVKAPQTSPPAFVRSPPRARAAPQKTRPKPKARTAAPQRERKPDAAHLHLLACAVRTAHGNGAAALLEASLSRAHPAPDPLLHDSQGQPVAARRVAELDPHAFRRRLRPIAGPDADLGALPDERLRALELLAEVFESLLPDAINLAASAAESEPEKSMLAGRIVALLPAAWSEAERGLGLRLLSRLSREQGAGLRWQVDVIATRPGIERSGAAVMKRAARALAQEPQARPWVLLAADSAISQDCVAQWESERHLYLPTHRKGWIPGEGAVGLIVAGAGARAWLPAHALRLRRPALGQRDAHASPLAGLSEAMLRDAGCDAGEIRAVVSDADDRIGHGREVVQWLAEGFPALAPEQDHPKVGAACGQVGVVAELLAIALAHHLVQKKKAPVLVASVCDASARGVSLLMPSV